MHNTHKVLCIFLSILCIQRNIRITLKDKERRKKSTDIKITKILTIMKTHLFTFCAIMDLYELFIRYCVL
jgi:hypothetical protein